MDDPFAELGLRLPDRPPASPETYDTAFDSLGLMLPGSRAAQAQAPQGGFYIPWEGRNVATASEYEKSLAEHLKSPPEQTGMERAKAAVSDIASGAGERVSRAWNALSDTFMGGVRQTSQGVDQLKAGQSASGVGNVLMGPVTATLGAALAGVSDPIKNELTKITGNPDFGEKAALMLPGSAGIKAAAKSVPTVNALNKVVEHIAEGGEVAVGTAINALRKNPSLTAMDVSPAVETTAIGIAKGAPSKGQETLFRRAGERADEAPTLIQQAYDTSMGKTPNVLELLDAYKKNARMVGEAMIEPALAKAGPVELTGIIKSIDEQIGSPALRALRNGDKPPLPLTPIQERLLHLRQDLTYRGKDEVLPIRDQYFMDATGAPNAAAQDAGVHGLQSRLRVESEALRQSASGAERQMGGLLGDYRGKLVDAIDKAAGGTAAKPGPYREALAAYRGEKEVEGAFQQGARGISNMQRTGEAGMENRPEFFKKWVDGLSDHELASARLGARAQIDNFIGFARNDARVGRSIPDAPFVEAKIKMLFGEKEGDTILEKLSHEKRKLEVNTNLTKQSVTARALAAQEETTPRTVKSIMESSRDVGNALMLPALGEVASGYMGGPTGLIGGGLTMLGAGRYGYQKVGRAHDIATNNRYAEIASSTEPEIKNALIRALEAKQAQLGGNKKSMNALSIAPQLLLSP